MVMRVDAVECDNPTCESVARPEHVKGPKTYTNPYGWFQILGMIVGTGPDFRADACSLECVGPAVEKMVQLAGERENPRGPVTS